ncbi:uncharacterized protein C4orf22 homolog [Copidosoma floridanum]|uniref:uncharacterized protein C4orf22 homolog n=1 Tax=Copidosoma floridanum TaxID=29053 RepID=UPI000C6F4F76|nr:uncharacterized protein C4orf22 homolog [Copidosoma floridanum]
MTEKLDFIRENQDLLKYDTFEDYIESFITPRDLYHLRSKSISRQIIELGYHTEGVLNQETFNKRVKMIKRYTYLIENPLELCTEFLPLDDNLLKELAFRERANRIGRFFTIIFMQYTGKVQSPVSAFIDYSYRLKAEDWMPYFMNTKRIKPKKNDLSFLNHKSGKLILNESPNFKPIVDSKNGLAFQNVHNLKFVHVSPTLTEKSYPSRTTIHSPIYGPVVLYDYSLRVGS